MCIFGLTCFNFCIFVEKQTSFLFKLHYLIVVLYLYSLICRKHCRCALNLLMFTAYGSISKTWASLSVKSLTFSFKMTEIHSKVLQTMFSGYFSKYNKIYIEPKKALSVLKIPKTGKMFKFLSF